MSNTAYTPNAALVSFLGLAPLVAVSGYFASGAIIAFGTAFGALALGIFARSTRLVIPQRLAMASRLGLAAFYALLLGILLDLWSPAIANDLGFFVPLIMVNGLLIHELRRSEAKDSPSLSSMFSSAFGYFAVGVFLALFREILGNGTLTLPTPGLRPKELDILTFAPLPILLVPAGGFMVLGLFAFINRLFARIIRGNEG